MNAAKARDSRFWEKWKEAGAVGTFSRLSPVIRYPRFYLSFSQQLLGGNYQHKGFSNVWLRHKCIAVIYYTNDNRWRLYFGPNHTKTGCGIFNSLEEAQKEVLNLLPDLNKYKNPL